jgi:hypothetical protein
MSAKWHKDNNSTLTIEMIDFLVSLEELPKFMYEWRQDLVNRMAESLIPEEMEEYAPHIKRVNEEYKPEYPNW